MKMLSIAAIVALPFLAACGKSTGPLTSEQKSTLKQTTDSAGRATNSARSANGSSSHARLLDTSAFDLDSNRSSSSSAAAASSGCAAAASSGGSSSSTAVACGGSGAAAAASGDSDSVQYEMAQAIRSGDCNVSVHEEKEADLFNLGSDNASGSGSKDFSILVSGGSCPVALDFNGTAALSSTSISVDLSLSYKVQRDWFRKLNDVDAIDLHGSLRATRTSFDIDLHGEIHSAKRGDVKITIKGNGKAEGDSGKGEIVAEYEFDNFVAELKYVISGTKQTYTLNGETITKSEFTGYLNKTIGSN